MITHTMDSTNAFKNMTRIELSNNKTRFTNKIQMCIDMFNTLIKDLSDTISKDFPNDHTLGTYKGVMENIITSKPLEPISLFLMHIYKNKEYRDNIMEKNDKFFINNDHSKITDGDQQKVSMMFQFKHCWKYMSDPLKDYVKSSLITLINITEQYVNFKVDLLDINKLLAS